MDLLVLSDQNGVVDMTHEAIARRTNRPIEVIRRTISELESPDPRSRTPDEKGIRLLRLDEHRDWGWEIVNYRRFREIASEEQRREKTKLRLRKFRANQADACSVTHRNADETGGNDFPYASPSAFASALEGECEGKPLDRTERITYDQSLRRIKAELATLKGGGLLPAAIERRNFLRKEEERLQSKLDIKA